MAVTQNTYTGNGSTVLYSFSFPYLESTDIKVSLNGTITTAYTLANATTIQFNTAPANGVAIRIYRETENENTKAMFYPGAAIRAQDLNDNFDQVLFVTQESTNTATAATSTANTALTNSATAISTANTAVSTANTASTNASAAVTTANTANSNASAAVTTANTANTNSTAAVSTANAASTTANTAASTAAGAVTTANGAVTTANTANTTANTALATANTAATNASTAISTANAASANATTAVNTANSAVTTANAASATANTASNNASAALNAVAGSLQYTLVANVAAIPASPVNNQAIEIANSTGIESFSPVANRPAGFVGDSGLSVRLQYTSTGSTWNWLNYFANDAENRYLKLSGGALTGQLKADDSTSVASPVIAFDGDTNTGIAHTGADELALVTGGTARVTVDPSGSVAVTNSLSVGGQTVVVTNDSRLSDTRTPTDGTVTNAKVAVGAAIDPAKISGTAVVNNDARLTDTRTPTDGSVTNAKVSAAAAIAGTKISPDFGSQNVTTTGTVTGASLNPTSSTVPTNGVYLPAANSVGISTGGSGRLFIDSSGRIGVGTSSPDSQITISRGTTSAFSVKAIRGNRTDQGIYTDGSGIYLFATDATNGSSYIGVTGDNVDSNNYKNIVFATYGSERLRIDSSGRVGIGTTSPVTSLVVSNGGAAGFEFNPAGFGTAPSIASYNRATSAYTQLSFDASQHIFYTSGLSNERARIDSSGRLLVGTSSTSADVRSIFQGTPASSNTTVLLSSVSSTPGSGDGLGYLTFSDSSHTFSAWVAAQRDGGTWSGSSKPTRLVFSVTRDGQASPTEAMRITNDGRLTLRREGFSGDPGFSTPGVYINAADSGSFGAARSGFAPLFVNRLTNDGDLVVFAQDTANEGSISVSGTTVSYNGAHLSRWSQLPGGAERTEILRGSVLSNIDEMCEWGEEDNEQLNRMKVSDVEGDKNVSGVFQAWDDDDDTYTNDFYCAMTGDFIIRIAAGVTVERGDLLMSAGDGTAKPQDDDIIRSKTIAKVTSTNVSCTYDDGSYCVPCVLMAC